MRALTLMLVFTLLAPGRAARPAALEQVQVTIPAASPADIEKMERARFDAQVRGDLAALERMLHDDLTYVHSNARRETKAEFLDSLKTGALKYVSIEPVDISVRTFGPAFAVIVGHARIKTLSQGKETPFVIRYTDVWVQRDGRWQMVAWQSTRISE